MNINEFIKNNESITKELNISNFPLIVKEMKNTNDTDKFYDFLVKIQNSANNNQFFVNKHFLKKIINSCKRQEKIQEILKSFSNLQSIKKQKLEKMLFEEKNYVQLLPKEYVNKFISKCVKILERMKKNEEQNPSPQNIIYLKNVVKYYQNNNISFRILDKVNLTIESGKFVVILGPSGSGKTTLLNLISGMDTPTSGQVIVCNENLINMNASKLTEFRKRNISYVFQQYGLLPNLTVKENVEIGANLQENKNLKLDINKVLESVGMLEYKKKMPYQLSGGQQQRVSIARSIAKNPKILFGDEPTGAVDQKNSDNIINLFKDINKKFGTTIVIVTHNPEIANVADMVVYVNDGKITVKTNIPNSSNNSNNNSNTVEKID